MDLAAIGFGVAGVTEEFVRRELESGRLRKLRTSFDIPPRSVDLCVLRDRAPDVCGPALQRFYPGEPAPGLNAVISDKTRPGNAGNFALSPPCFCTGNRAE